MPNSGRGNRGNQKSWPCLESDPGCTHAFRETPIFWFKLPHSQTWNEHFWSGVPIYHCISFWPIISQFCWYGRNVSQNILNKKPDSPGKIWSLLYAQLPDPFTPCSTTWPHPPDLGKMTIIHKPKYPSASSNMAMENPAEISSMIFPAINLHCCFGDLTRAYPSHLRQVAQLFQSSQSIFIASWESFLDPNPGRKRWGIRAFIWHSSDIHDTSWYITLYSQKSSYHISNHHEALLKISNHHSEGLENLWTFQISNPPFMNSKNHRSCRLGSCLGCIRGGKSWSARPRFAGEKHGWQMIKLVFSTQYLDLFGRFGQLGNPFLSASWELRVTFYKVSQLSFTQWKKRVPIPAVLWHFQSGDDCQFNQFQS